MITCTTPFAKSVWYLVFIFFHFNYITSESIEVINKYVRLTLGIPKA